MEISQLLSVGLLVAGFVAAVAAYYNTRRKRAAGPSRTPTDAAPPEDVPVVDDPLAGLQAKDWQTRLAAVGALVASLPEDPDRRTSALFALLPLLNDPDNDVREAAVTALVQTGALAVPGLASVMTAGDVNAREAAVRALGEIGGRAAIDALVNALDDPSAWVRIPAARGLGENHVVRAVDPLIGKLDDEDPGVREAVKAALTTIGTRKALMAVAGR